MKKKLMSFVMALMAVTCVSVLSSCDGVMDNAVLHMWQVSITGDGVKDGKATMKIETTLQLGLNIVPSNVNVVDPVWSSSDESVATVDANGLVTAVAVGVTTINVYSAFNPEVKNSIELTVAEVPVEAVNITAPATPFEMTLGDEDITLTATVTPADATNKKVTWSSSAPTVATIDETGKVHAVAAGTTTIKATTANGKEASIELTVNAPKATVTTAPTAKTGVKAGENAAIINAGVASGGTMMYALTTTNTKPTSTLLFGSTVPTAKSLAAGTYYVWYYVKADATHADSDIAGSVSVTIASAGIALNITTPAKGQLICDDGKNYAYGSVPSGVTAVAKICYVSGNNGLALALKDDADGTMKWVDANPIAVAHQPAFTNGTWRLPTKDEWINMRGSEQSDYVSLRDGFTSVGGTNMASYYYWGDSYDSSNATYIILDDSYMAGLTGTGPKNSNKRTFRVRAVLVF